MLSGSTIVGRVASAGPARSPATPRSKYSSWVALHPFVTKVVSDLPRRQTGIIEQSGHVVTPIVRCGTSNAVPATTVRMYFPRVVRVAERTRRRQEGPQRLRLDVPPLQDDPLPGDPDHGAMKPHHALVETNRRSRSSAGNSPMRQPNPECASCMSIRAPWVPVLLQFLAQCLQEVGEMPNKPANSCSLE